MFLQVKNLWKEELTISPRDNSEVDLILYLGEEKNRLYQKLVDMSEWMVQIGIFEIHYEVTSLNHFFVAPREDHLNRLVQIFGYLNHITGRRKVIVISTEYIRDNNVMEYITTDLLEKYPYAK